MGRKYNFFDQLGSIRCKPIVRWQHLSRIKARLLWLAENVISPIKTQQATSGTSAATYKVMLSEKYHFIVLHFILFWSRQVLAIFRLTWSEKEFRMPACFYWNSAEAWTRTFKGSVNLRNGKMWAFWWVKNVTLHKATIKDALMDQRVSLNWLKLTLDGTK